jgi:hypothetical protein
MADLEIRIFRRNDNGYPVEITLGGQQEFPHGVLDAGIESWSASGDLIKDGQWLFETFLADAALRSAWDTARGQCPQRRIRLRIDPTAAKLHGLPWELLCEGDTLLATHADTPFSRYLPIALPWGGAVEDRPIRVLVTISNPANLDQYNLASLDVAQERETLEAALTAVGNLTVTFLEPPVTLERLEAELRKGYHIWHYLGHGVYSTRRQQAALYLQDAQGQTHVTPDDELAGVLHRLETGVKPQLVFLAACQSAVRDTRDAFRGLGPRLVAIGVPAVMAMQDTVSIEAARKFSTTFYARLLEHGLVDQASNEARSTLLTTGQPDVVVPVLFMRLKSGQLWSAEADARGKLLGSQMPRVFWETLMEQIEEETCVPIIGPRVHGHWLPTPHDIAQLWADKYDYPLGDRENLAHVAQYLDAISGNDYSQGRLQRLLRQEFKARLPEGLQPRGKAKTLTALVEKTLQQDLSSDAPGETPLPVGWERLAAQDPNEPHRVLARLDLPLYLTTNCDNFMVEALRAEGKEPRRDYCRWREGLPDLDPALETYEPTPEAPLVYHLFGSDQEKHSLVVSEDHYLDFLSNVLIKKDRIPYAIRGPLARCMLLFVGYNLHDWEFRVVMRGLVKTVAFKNEREHVAVQLQDVSAATEEAVRSFLQQYLFKREQISVFWGSPAQFIAELREQWEAY